MPQNIKTKEDLCRMLLQLKLMQKPIFKRALKVFDQNQGFDKFLDQVHKFLHVGKFMHLTRIKKRQWLFCRWRKFTLRDYFAVSYLWLVNLNDVLNMWVLVVSDWSILKTIKKNFAPPSLYPPPSTLPSSVHCPVHLHTVPAPSVYAAFLLMPCQLRFEPQFVLAGFDAVLMFSRINLITNWGKFCTCCCLGENSALVPNFWMAIASLALSWQRPGSKTLHKNSLSNIKLYLQNSSCRSLYVQNFKQCFINYKVNSLFPFSEVPTTGRFLSYCFT